MSRGRWMTRYMESVTEELDAEEAVIRWLVNFLQKKNE